MPHLPGLALNGGALPPPYTPLQQVPLVLLVGVTGVGKSTTLGALNALGVRLQVLPNRREVTDAVMIAPFAVGPVTDREERFRLTARYREAHPGGMAQALASLALDPGTWRGPLLFDGLRGRNEVEYAVRELPQARFIALCAPDPVRVRRLLGRADAFDAIQVGLVANDLLGQLQSLPGARDVFSAAELAELAALPAQGLDAADVLAKTRIVLSERQHYDPAAANAFLQGLPSERALVLDTAALPPQEVARRIQEWL